jgi:hypothetical protein
MNVRRTLARVAFAAVVALSLAACSGANSVLERLDERTGVVLLRAREPLVFARTEPRYSRSLRDYLYVGPVESNRQGVREYFLWVGIATTLDRGFIAPLAELPSTLYVTIAGEPIVLPLAPWHDLVQTRTTEPVYRTAVPLRAELAARVTLQQLALLDAAQLETVAVDGAARTAVLGYRRWESKAGYGDFLARVAARREPGR